MFGPKKGGQQRRVVFNGFCRVAKVGDHIGEAKSFELIQAAFVMIKVRYCGPRTEELV